MSEEAQTTAPAERDRPNREALRLAAIEIDRKAMDARQWEPAQLWAQWRRYCKEQESATPARSCLISEFQLQLGLTTPHLDVWAERGGEWANVAKKIELDQMARIEAKLLSGGHSQIACIFWLKNKAGWRDKSPEEAKEERDDWLSRVQIAKGDAMAADRADAPPDSGPSLQLPGTDDLTADADFDPPGATPAITAKSA